MITSERCWVEFFNDKNIIVVSCQHFILFLILYRIKNSFISWYIYQFYFIITINSMTNFDLLFCTICLYCNFNDIHISINSIIIKIFRNFKQFFFLSLRNILRYINVQQFYIRKFWTKNLLGNNSYRRYQRSNIPADKCAKTTLP